jgi:hypothetical protein
VIAAPLPRTRQRCRRAGHIPKRVVTPLANTSQMRSVPCLKDDHGASRFRRMRREARQVRVGPVGQVDDLARLDPRFRGLGRLKDAQSVVVEKEGVIAEQAIEPWNHRIVVGNGLGFELAQRSLDPGLRSISSRAPCCFYSCVTGLAPARVAGPPTCQWSSAILGHPAPRQMGGRAMTSNFYLARMPCGKPDATPALARRLRYHSARARFDSARIAGVGAQRASHRDTAMHFNMAASHHRPGT